MGIQGLLPALKSISTPTNVSDYSGMRVAVDTYSWLHKAAFSCSKDICHGRAPASLVNYCMHRVNLLRHHGVKPLLVFDGGPLPMKAEQEEKRSRVREEHLRRARECEASGNHAAAYDHYQKAVDITPEVAYQLILVLLRDNVEFIVSPYEADAQMAFLALHGLVDAVITEDSDLVAYGCPKILFKMDKNGQGFELQYADLVKNRDINFTSFSKRMVLEMCIFSGCDYLPSLQGMGVKRAYNLMRRFRSYDKVIRHLKFSGVIIPKSYEQGFRKAVLTFSHHLVYDPSRDDLVHLTDVAPDCYEALDFLGPKLSQVLVRQIVRGLIHPVTHFPFQQPEPPAAPPPKSLCAEKKRISKQVEQKRLALPAQRNVLTNYFISKSDASIQQFKAPRPSESPEEVEYCEFRETEARLSPRTPSSSPDRNPAPSSPKADEGTEQEDTGIYGDNKRVRGQYEDEPRNNSGWEIGGEHSLRAHSQCKAVALSKFFVPRLSNVNDENAMRNVKKRAKKASCPKAVEGRKYNTTPEASLPKFSSSLFGVDMEQAATLSSNITHTKQYSAIAQESIEEFTRKISVFAHGARVSGLRRPPLKSNLTNINRVCEAMGGYFIKGKENLASSVRRAPPSNVSPLADNGQSSCVAQARQGKEAEATSSNQGDDDLDDGVVDMDCSEESSSISSCYWLDDEADVRGKRRLVDLASDDNSRAWKRRRTELFVERAESSSGSKKRSVEVDERQNGSGKRAKTGGSSNGEASVIRKAVKRSDAIDIRDKRVAKKPRLETRERKRKRVWWCDEVETTTTAGVKADFGDGAQFQQRFAQTLFL